MAASTTTIIIPAIHSGSIALDITGRMDSGSSRLGYRARPAIPVNTAPTSNRKMTRTEIDMAGTRLFSERADIKRTINCGTPINGTPMARKLITPMMASVLLPSGPQGLSKPGSWAISLAEMASQPPPALIEMTGRMIKPSNIKIPWIKSVQATALKPPTRV